MSGDEPVFSFRLSRVLDRRGANCTVFDCGQYRAVFFKMSYFGLKQDLVRSFFGQKRDFGSKHGISGLFRSEKVKFDLLSHF